MLDFTFKGHVKTYKERGRECSKRRGFDKDAVAKGLRKYRCELLLQGHSREYCSAVSDQAIRDWRDEGDALRKKLAAKEKELDLLQQEKMELVEQIIVKAPFKGYVGVMTDMFAEALLDCRDDEHTTKVLTEIFVEQLQEIGYQWDQIPTILAVASEKLLNYIEAIELKRLP